MSETFIFWETWDQLIGQGPPASDPAGSTVILKALTNAGDSPSPLVADSDGTTHTGDLIELGFFVNAAGAAESSTRFKGTWKPITSKTTIGQKYGSTAVPDGEFQFKTMFTDDGGSSGNNLLALTGNPSATADTLYIGDDQPTDILANIDLLNATSNAFIGVRFYDISTAGNPPTPSGTDGATKVNGTTRYNTIMDAAWMWPGKAAKEVISLHDSDGGVDNSVEFEFDNTAAYTANLAKVGTGNTRVENDDYVATVTYHDGSSNLALNTIGSSVISGLSGSGTLTDNGSGKTLTLHSRTGNTVADAYSFGGTITGDTTVIKTGEGEQKLTSTLSVSDTTGFVYIDDGIFNLAPSSTGVTQSMEYLTSATSLGSTDPIFALDNDNGADQTVTFGLTDSSHTSTDREFKGKVYLSDSGTNTLKVSSNTASGDYAKTQILSGVISGSSGGTAQAGSAKLKKTGKGRLELSGANTFNGGVDIDDGTVVAGHDDSLGSGTITINKGKLEVSSGVTISETIQGGSGKSLIGGDGTVSSVTIGSGANEIDYLSPGQGISSSLSPSQKQVGLGNGAADDAIGSFTATTLSLQGGGVYDWEMQDFDGTTGGTDYDVMNFTNLSFGSSSDRFTINIMGIKSSDGTEGAPDNLASIWGKSRQTTNGFKFLTDGGGSGGGITWGAWNAGNIDDYFEFRFDDLAYNASNNGQYNQWGQDWSVYYNNGDFYLQFSAVPEPSTYIMVTGLFMLPGFRMFRKWRKRSTSSVTDTEEA